METPRLGVLSVEVDRRAEGGARPLPVSPGVEDLPALRERAALSLEAAGGAEEVGRLGEGTERALEVSLPAAGAPEVQLDLGVEDRVTHDELRRLLEGLGRRGGLARVELDAGERREDVASRQVFLGAAERLPERATGARDVAARAKGFCLRDDGSKVPVRLRHASAFWPWPVKRAKISCPKRPPKRRIRKAFGDCDRKRWLHSLRLPAILVPVSRNFTRDRPTGSSHGARVVGSGRSYLPTRTRGMGSRTPWVEGRRGVVMQSGTKTVVRSTEPRKPLMRVSEATFDRVRESGFERVVRSSLERLSRDLLALRVEGGGE